VRRCSTRRNGIGRRDSAEGIASFRFRAAYGRSDFGKLCQLLKCHNFLSDGWITGLTLLLMKIAIFLFASILFGGISASLEEQEAKQGTSNPSVIPQVRPALPEEKSTFAEQQERDSRAATEAYKAASQERVLEAEKVAHETRLRGYWVDPIANLMWEGNDNGVAVPWRKAAKYCGDLRLAGYSDWRLATLDELASLVDVRPTLTYHFEDGADITINGGLGVRGGLRLSGNPWSSTRELDRFGKPYGEGWFFDFNIGKPSGDLPYLRNTKYALCVRKSSARGF